MEEGIELETLNVGGVARLELEIYQPAFWKLLYIKLERTHKQLKEHYLNYLRPEIKKEEWTLEEDLKLVELLNRYGKEWKIIERNFEGRTQNQIKNRYFGRLKKLG